MEVQLTSDPKGIRPPRRGNGTVAQRGRSGPRSACVVGRPRRRHVEFLASLDRSRASLAHHEGREITKESMRELAAKVRTRGRARLTVQMPNTG
jgi:hypothetical protein